MSFWQTVKPLVFAAKCKLHYQPCKGVKGTLDSEYPHNSELADSASHPATVRQERQCGSVLQLKHSMDSTEVGNSADTEPSSFVATNSSTQWPGFYTALPILKENIAADHSLCRLFRRRDLLARSMPHLSGISVT
jgi:hypothetical protein